MGIQLNFRVLGTGFPCVLLHGNGEDHRYFKRQMPAFGEQYRVIAVDTRGHGQSPRGSAPFTLAQFAEDLKGLLDSLGIARCHLLGFSDGGNIALLFALRYPEYVRGLILNGANFNPAGLKAETLLPCALQWGRLWPVRHLNGKLTRRWELLNLMVTQPKLTQQDLAGLRVPTLVVAGENDMIKDAHTRALAAAISGSELAILPGDHFVARRNWQIFNPVALDFLASCDEKGVLQDGK